MLSGIRRGTRLRPRNTEQADQDAQYEYLKERYNRFTREFTKQKAKKDALERGEGTEAEISYYQDLREDANIFQNVRRARNLNRPVDLSPLNFTPEQVGRLYDRHIEFLRRYGGQNNQELATRLTQRDQTLPKEV